MHINRRFKLSKSLKILAVLRQTFTAQYMYEQKHSLFRIVKNPEYSTSQSIDMHYLCCFLSNSLSPDFNLSYYLGSVAHAEDGHSYSTTPQHRIWGSVSGEGPKDSVSPFHVTWGFTRIRNPLYI